jgi:23S rRNA pseudouridine1911/1915/1917 synthase
VSFRFKAFVERSWTVMAGDAGARLDAFLRAQLPFLSRRELEDALHEGCFTTNGRSARKGHRLAEGDVVQFSGPSATLSNAPIPNPRLRVPVIYEDASLLAFNKPAGMACHGFSGRDDATLTNFLLAGWPELAKVGKSRWDPGLVHRIDRATSGLVLAAKTQLIFTAMRSQFRRRIVTKKYLALVSGSSAEAGTIALPLCHDPKDRRKMQAVTEPGQSEPKRKIWPALTRYRKLSEKDGVSFLQLAMETGVTHQLRAHLAAIGHCIVGDELYGTDVQETFGLRRHFLHASELRFMHPVTRSAVDLAAPLPGELVAVLARLKIPFDLGRK